MIITRYIVIYGNWISDNLLSWISALFYINCEIKHSDQINIRVLSLLLLIGNALGISLLRDYAWFSCFIVITLLPNHRSLGINKYLERLCECHLSTKGRDSTNCLVTVMILDKHSNHLSKRLHDSCILLVNCLNQLAIDYDSPLKQTWDKEQRLDCVNPVIWPSLSKGMSSRNLVLYFLNILETAFWRWGFQTSSFSSPWPSP